MSAFSKLAERRLRGLFPAGSEEANLLLEALRRPPPRGNACLIAREESVKINRGFIREDQPEWIPKGILCLASGVEPKDLNLELSDGFYPLDFSSVLAASSLFELCQSAPRERVLDLCAAPGGKSILTARFLKPGRLLSNEVIGKRLGILRHNLAKFGVDKVWTQRLDPGLLLDKARMGFDGVLVDAPCSGQSLLAKGIENPGCFHPQTIQHNVRRQRRILRAAAQLCAPQGWLLYTTCTFSLEENEKNLAWFLRNYPHFHPQEQPQLMSYRSTHSSHPCYRTYPFEGTGAGAFSVFLKNSLEGERMDYDEVDGLWDYPA